MSKEKRNGMPTAEKIFKFWDENSHVLGSVKQGEDGGIVERECFACGNQLQALHRAHIVPIIDGGTHDLNNLHLLCQGCHAESEGIIEYWSWIKYKRYNEWKYISEHFDLFLKRQGIDVEKEIKKDDFDAEELHRRVLLLLRKKKVKFPND